MPYLFSTRPFFFAYLGASFFAPTAFAEHSPTAGISARIVGGAESQDCAWPSTVSVKNCTGTLVHPELVVYAAHCGDSIDVITFGSSSKKPARTVKTKKCEVYPNGGVRGNDYAYCVLAEAVTDIPLVPVAMGSEAQFIRKNQDVWAVGFGYYNQRKDYGIKHEVQLKISGFTGDDDAVIVAGGDGKDACQGDSGGPLFTKMADGQGYRLVGITSFGYEGEGAGSLACGFGGGWAIAHLQMQWLEEQSGLDLTPCHDALGNPDPDERCGAQPVDPGKASGTWATSCDWGEQRAAHKDQAPAIRWAQAVSTTARQVGEPFDVELVVRDDRGIQRVELTVNGQAHESKSAAPYRWSITIPDEEQLSLRGFAIDDAGQRSDALALDLPLKVRTNPSTTTPETPSVSDTTGGQTSESPEQTPPPAAPQGRESCSLAPDASPSLAWALVPWVLLRRRRRSS